MVLTAENYYSQEANEEYMSVSQFKQPCCSRGIITGSFARCSRYRKHIQGF